MTMAKWLRVVSGIVPLLASESYCHAEHFRWQARSSDEVEFGVTALVGNVREQSPSTIESGYNGAWDFGSETHFGIAQTFTVSSLRTLESIELRVAGFDRRRPSGQFEVAVYRFNPVDSVDEEKLASALRNAEDYSHLELTMAVLVSFDMSSFNVLLNPEETYALTVTPTATYTGGPMTVQSALDIYPGGKPYHVSVVPEPAAWLLVTIAGLAWLLCRPAAQLRQ
jgi:hypothetical protein